MKKFFVGDWCKMNTISPFARGIAAATVAFLGVDMSHATTAHFRADVRQCAQIATGVEALGSADGSAVTPWDTTALADGWTPRVSGGISTNVLVLNGASVVGGRLSTNETWGAAAMDHGADYVVRHDVVVPSGVSLSITADTIVKFAGGAKLIVEDGGAVIADGALLADFADDSVGGDTNMDGAGTTPTTVWEDWTEGVADGDLVRVLLYDGAAPAAPARAYTTGRPLGALPALSREGARFEGWRTAPDGGGEAVSAATLAGAAVATLHASWTIFSLDLAPASTNLAATAGNCTFAVAANAAWTVSTDADWITLRTRRGNGNGTAGFTVAANESTGQRTGTVRVTLAEGGISRDFTVTQSAMEQVAAPAIVPGDGTTFRASAQRVAIRCATSGATIRYTLDGSDPTASSAVCGSAGFNVFDTTTVKARAFKDGMLPSAVVSARFVRLLTLAEALDVPLWTVTTDGDAPWTVDAGISSEGTGSSARSGVIGDDQTTALHAGVEGSGTLSFRWRASCEESPDADYPWDYLSFEADGAVRATLDGQTGWLDVSVTLGAGAHSLVWRFQKDFMDGDDVGEDCGWVDRVTWTPTVVSDSAAIPVSWFENQGLVAMGGTAEAAASADPDRDGLTTAEEYVAGTDPNDTSSTFRADIEIVDGRPVVTWTPDLLGERAYRTLGTKSLGADAQWDDVTDIDDPGAEGYRFFKVSVGMD